MGSEQAPPEGEIRTFLIADVRGYTRFTQQHGDEAAARLASRFAAVVGEVVEERGGRVVELRGDEALCVFVSPRQAVRAAVALEQRCADEIRADPTLPLRVGIGLDAGEAVAVEGGYRGGALNLAARLCSIAKAGEVLVSEGVVLLGARTEEISFTSRGQVRLKGMKQPVRYHSAVFPLELPEEQADGGRSMLWLAALAAAIAAAALAVATVLATTRSSGEPPTLEGNSVGQFDARSGELLSQTPLPGAPSSLALGDGYVWAGDPAAGRVVGINLQDGSVNAAAADGGVDGLAVSDNGIWVVHGNTASAERIDPATLRTIEASQASVGAGASAAVAVGGVVWVVNSDDGSVQSFDDTRGTPRALIPLGPQPVAVAAGLGSVWVLDEAGGTLTEIDPEREEVVATVPVPIGGRALAVGLGAVWVAVPTTDAVIRIDPANPDAQPQVRVADPQAVTIAGGAVWAGTAAGTLVRIDPATLEVTATKDVGSPVTALAGGSDRLFVGAQAPLGEHRGGTLRVVVSGIDSLDPAISYSPEAWSALSITNDGLVGFRRVGGATGSLLVPDLATSIPAPTDDGRTYRFVLREGIRYSDGEPVLASDVRRAVERAFAAHVEEPGSDDLEPATGSLFFASLVGAEDCRPARSCDLRRGVVVDDERRTVEFRLRQPDSRFLYALALPFSFPVPEGAPAVPSFEDPGVTVPATGAYAIESYRPADEAAGMEGSLVLTRNPHFRVWSVAARPDGFPDRIVFRAGMPLGPAVRLVERGDADVTSASIVHREFNRLAEAYPSRLHLTAAGQVFTMFMNTQVRPFDDVRVRRAVNYALDRDRLAGGDELAITCQVLPRGISGYRPYCPYTLGGGPEYRGPDLDRAQQLVEASGTAGMSVTVWGAPAAFLPQGPVRYTAQVLDQLGYDARARFLPDFKYFEALHDPQHTLRIGGYGWLQDYPAPSDFLDLLFRCGSDSNPSRFCEPAIDQRMDRALELELTDPTAASQLWAEIDQQVTDAAPWATFVNPRAADFLSERAGNFQRNPQWGLLLEQLWLR